MRNPFRRPSDPAEGDMPYPDPPSEVAHLGHDLHPWPFGGGSTHVRWQCTRPLAHRPGAFCGWVVARYSSSLPLYGDGQGESCESRAERLAAQAAGKAVPR